MAADHRGSKPRPAATKRKKAPVAEPQAANTGPQLVVDCKYRNDLPLPPVPKLLRALPSLERMCQYQPSSLELDNRPFMLSERQLMSRVEIVDPDAYGEAPAAGSMPPPPPPLDGQLLKDDDVTEEMRESAKKKARLLEYTEAWHRQAFGLQLPQLITNDVFTERQRFTTGLNATEKKMFRDPPGYKDVEELSDLIEKSFDKAQEAPVHPTNPRLKAKKVLPIVPDAVLWANRYLQVVFDELPPDHAVAQHDVLFRSTPDPRTTCFGFFAPPSQEEAGEAGTYRLSQNYYWDNRGGFTVSSDIGEGECLLLSMPEDETDEQELRFLVVPTSMKMKKQKAFRLDIEAETHALNVSFREPNPSEQVEEQERMNAVLSEEVVKERSEASLDYVEGEWTIRGDPRSTRSASGRPASSPHDAASHAASRRSSYYKTVGGERYNRAIYEQAEQLLQDGQINLDGARQLWEEAKAKGVTGSTKKTLLHIAEEMNCTSNAAGYLKDKVTEATGTLALAMSPAPSPFLESPLAPATQSPAPRT